MKPQHLLILLFSLLAVSCTVQTKDCMTNKVHGWSAAYNEYYHKYAAARYDSLAQEMEFLLKDHHGEYFVFGEQWESCEKEYGLGSCASSSLSLFSDKCDLKKFIDDHYDKLKKDKWQIK